MRFKITYLLLFFTTLLFAQAEIDTEEQYLLLMKKVEEFVLDGEDEKAWKNTLAAAKLWKDSDPLFGFLEAFETGASFYISDEFAKKRIAKDYKTAAKYYTYAIAEFQQPFAKHLDDEVEYLADIQTLLGFAFKKTSQIIEAKNAYQKAFSAYRHLDSMSYEYDKRWISLYVYKPLANIYTRLENYENAASLLLLSKSILSEYGKGDEEAQVAIDLGILQATQGKHKEAIRVFSKYAEDKKLSTYVKAILLLNRGRNLLALAQHEEAFIDIEKAISFIEKENYPVVLLDAYHILGQLEIQTAQFKKAKKSLAQSITLGRKHLSAKSRKISKVYASLGQLYLKEKEPKRALNAFQKSLACVIANIDTTAIFSTPKQEDLYAENSILMALTGKAEAFELWYTLDHRSEELEYALENLSAAFDVEHLLQNTQQHSDSKIQFQNQNRTRRETALRICAELYEKTNDATYQDIAFQIMEASKSAVLLASVRENLARQQLSGQASLLSSLSETKQALAAIKAEFLAAEFDKEKVEEVIFTQLNEQKVFLSQKLLTIQESLKKRHPQYDKFIKQSTQFTVAEVQNKILKNDSEAFVEYFWGTNYLYVFIIHKTKIDYKKIPLNTNLRQSVDNFLAVFSAKNRWNTGATLYQQRAIDLYQKIYAPLHLNDTKKVIIIPDGLLAFVSFEALVNKKQETSSFKNMDYLIHQQNIQYAYSANVLVEQKKIKSYGKQFLFVAPIFKNQEQGLPTLEISDLDIGHPSSLKTLLDENASRANFEKEATKSRVIHLFTHAEASENGQPKVYFHDRFLSLAEIYALDLSTELVVLSACETNLGKLEKGEGVMSLARGFAYAGSAGLIASLWKVKNQQTATLFTSFYQQKNKGEHTSEALRNAKLQYLKSTNDIHASPAYWTGFVFIGNDEEVEKKSFWWWYIFGGLVAIVLIVFLKKKKK